MSDAADRSSGPLPGRRPTVEVLGQPLRERIVSQALDVLGKVGVFVDSPEALTLLGDSGAHIDKKKRRAVLPADLVERCVDSAPRSIRLFTREGEPAVRLEGLRVHFNPGSAAVKILDGASGQTRSPVRSDLVAMARLADALPNLGLQSTALVPADVPQNIADRYRLWVALLYSAKPIVTGTFTIEGLSVMRQMLLAVAGNEQRLRELPIAIFDVCPTSPLKWGPLAAQGLLDCARWGIPAEIVSAPLLGATASVTLAGALVQHTAENLSGIVIHQLAARGGPVIYGGAPAAFDMRYATPATGAAETILAVCAAAQIGRSLGLPTHGYLVLSDAKLLDAQAGLESAAGAVMAALAGINLVSGAGMLESESCQSLEKLVIDDAICGMALRVVEGIQPRGQVLAEDLLGDLAAKDHFLVSPTTLRWLRDEMPLPGPLIDRLPREAWEKRGRNSIVQNARKRVLDLLAFHQPRPLPEDVHRHLAEIMAEDAKRHGLGELPMPA